MQKEKNTDKDYCNNQVSEGTLSIASHPPGEPDQECFLNHVGYSHRSLGIAYPYGYNYIKTSKQAEQFKRQNRPKRPLRTAVFMAVLVVAFVAASTLFYGYWETGKIIWPPKGFIATDIKGLRSQPVLVSNDKSGLDNLPRAQVGSGLTVKLSKPKNQSPLTKQEIYMKCSPSVVAIMAESENESNYSWGSGVILSEDGYILTNCHILEEETVAVTVTLSDDSQYKAELVGADIHTDLAVLKIEASGLPIAEFGDSSLLEVGEEVLAIGNPLGSDLRGTVTNGIISAINRDIDYGGYTMTFLQTTAAINEGNSGGPLINMFGQVIGITHMKIVSYYVMVEGIAFAIPTRSIKPVVDELIEKGYVSGRPAIGVFVEQISSNNKNYKNLPEGVCVVSIYEQTDAYKKGIRPGDIIVAVEGTSVKTSVDMNVIKENFQVGDPLTITIFRNGDTFDVEVRLADMAELR